MSTRRMLAALTTVALLSSCSGPGNWFGLRKRTSDATITVAAALYPLAEAITRVAGSHVKVLDLTPAGKDAHEVELTAKQLQELDTAAAVFYIGADFQPSVQKAITSVKKPIKVDVLDSVETLTVDQLDGGVGTQFATRATTDAAIDPHVWLDPTNMVRIVEKVREVLIGLLPKFETELNENAARYIADVRAVDDLITVVKWDPTERILHCTYSRIVTSHQGLAYLMRRGGMGILPIVGVNPDEQVSAKRMEEIAAMISSDKFGLSHTVLLEEMLPETVARAIAAKAGASVATVNPLEGMTSTDIKQGKNWVSVMRDNIATITTAMGCK